MPTIILNHAHFRVYTQLLYVGMPLWRKNVYSQCWQAQNGTLFVHHHGESGRGVP